MLSSTKDKNSEMHVARWALIVAPVLLNIKLSAMAENKMRAIEEHFNPPLNLDEMD